MQSGPQPIRAICTRESRLVTRGIGEPSLAILPYVGGVVKDMSKNKRLQLFSVP